MNNEEIEEILDKQDLIEKISILKISIGAMKRQIKKSKEDFCKQEVWTIDAFYKSVKLYLPELKEDFNNLINFHNKMIENRKSDFRFLIEKELKELEKLEKEL